MDQGLPTTSLGSTGFSVTKLGFGAMEIRGAPRARAVTPKQADSILNAVLDAGINYIDTSIDYGTSEEFIGQFISHRRDEFFVASKCGCPVGAVETPNGLSQPHDFTPKNIIAGVEQSLRRMKTDYLDVLQLHHNPSQQNLEAHGSVEAMLKLKEEGKVRHIGISNTLPDLPDHIEMGVFEVMQIPYSALQREHENLIVSASAAGIGTVIRGGVAKGDPDQSGIPRRDSWALFESAGLQELIDEGEDKTSFMLRFTLSHPEMDTTIVGTLNPQHLTNNVEATLKGPLTDEVYERAKQLLTTAGESPAPAVQS